MGPPLGQFTGKSHIVLGTIYEGKVSVCAHLDRRQFRGANTGTRQSTSRMLYTDYKLSVTRVLRTNRSLTLVETWINGNHIIYILNGHNVGSHHLALTLEIDSLTANNMQHILAIQLIIGYIF